MFDPLSDLMNAQEAPSDPKVPQDITLIRIQNPSEYNFEFDYGKSEGYPPIVMKAQQVRTFPRQQGMWVARQLTKAIAEKSGDPARDSIYLEETVKQKMFDYGIIVGQEDNDRGVIQEEEAQELPQENEATLEASTPKIGKNPYKNRKKK